ncbi:MAG: hypothetical protein M3Q49_19370 [Actinomycetota bacterium]|nr:hypothetical protein [Actinomycetota bacterium]
MDIGRIEAAEASLNAFIEKRARGAKSGRDHANEEAERQRAADARYRSGLQLVHAKAWVGYYGALALRYHDLAAEAAAKRDEARELLTELESHHREERKTA